MKTYQLFIEQLKTGPQIGDYVICDEINGSFQKLRNFLNNNIGQIYDITNNVYDDDYNEIHYYVSYNNIPAELICFFKNFKEDNDRIMLSEEIIFFSNNIEDCEMYLTTKNFNL